MSQKTNTTQSPLPELNYPSIFIHGDLEFGVESFKLAFSHRQISVFGVTGLPWKPLSPRKHFGLKTTVEVRIPPPYSFQFITEAYIMRETSGISETMGLKFRMQAADREKLSALIQRFGGYPKEYNRKYPRIPTSQNISTYPLRVLANTGETHMSVNAPLILDVRNLSVGGLLVSTENPFSLTIMPGNGIDMLFEPRGDFSAQIQVHGIVRRVSDEISWENGNVIRYLGIQFTEITGDNRALFLDLLRDILTKMKHRDPKNT